MPGCVCVFLPLCPGCVASQEHLRGHSGQQSAGIGRPSMVRSNRAVGHSEHPVPMPAHTLTPENHFLFGRREAATSFYATTTIVVSLPPGLPDCHTPPLPPELWPSAPLVPARLRSAATLAAFGSRRRQLKGYPRPGCRRPPEGWPVAARCPASVRRRRPYKSRGVAAAVAVACKCLPWWWLLPSIRLQPGETRPGHWWTEGHAR